MAEPPPPSFPDRFFRLPMVRQRPLQKRILEYLNRGGRPSINAISTDLDIWRFSAQRCLRLMKNHGFVEDQWVYATPGVASGIKAHTFHITDRGMKELELLQSLGEPHKTYPLGYRILLFLPDGYPVTIGWIAKLLGKDTGEVERTMKSLQNKGLVDCLCSKTRTSLGNDMITHLYRITELGRKVSDADPVEYVQEIRSRCRSKLRF